jgi:hypothetical protein
MISLFVSFVLDKDSYPLISIASTFTAHYVTCLWNEISNGTNTADREREYEVGNISLCVLTPELQSIAVKSHMFVFNDRQHRVFPMKHDDASNAYDRTSLANSNFNNRQKKKKNNYKSAIHIN